MTIGLGKDYNPSIRLASSTSRVSSSRTVSTLALYHTKRLYDRLGRILRDAHGVDTYSQAHLQDMHERLGNALDIVYTM